MEVVDWFRDLPPLTRCWFGGTMTLSLAEKFGMVSNVHLILNCRKVLCDFQIWRYFTAFFFYPMGIGLLVNLYFLVSYSSALETGKYVTRPADYAFMLLFNWIFCTIGCLIMNIPLLMDAMVVSVLYVWCNLNPGAMVQFWFGTQFRAAIFPWALLIFRWIIDGSGWSELIGILVGHLYFFLKYDYAQQYSGSDLLPTPGFLETCLPPRQVLRGIGRVLNTGSPTTKVTGTGDAGRSGAHAWGPGQALG